MLSPYRTSFQQSSALVQSQLAISSSSYFARHHCSAATLALRKRHAIPSSSSPLIPRIPSINTIPIQHPTAYRFYHPSAPLKFLISPSPTANMTSTYKLKDLSPSDLKDGDKIAAQVDGIEDGSVLVVKLDGQIHAMTAKCTHYGAPLMKGVLTPDGRITCPWHGG